MDKTTMVEPDIELGKRVTEALDESGISVRASLWFYIADSEEWRLIIATSLVDDLGAKKTYEKIQKILKSEEISELLPLRRVTAVSPSDDLIKLLCSAVKTGPTISGIRFRHNVVNGVFIEDAYIYRLT